MTKLTTIISNALRPGYAAEMSRKVMRRLGATATSNDPADITAWCRQHSTPIDSWARGLDENIWKEAEEFAISQRQYAARKLEDLDIELGGGGAYDLLYFLTRLLRPEVIVESGVAAGFSSRAFFDSVER